MGSKNQQVQQTTEPWSGAKPYLTDLYKAGSTLMQSGAKPFEGQLTADPTQVQKDALAGVQAAAGKWAPQADATRAMQPKFGEQAEAWRGLQPGFNDAAGVIQGLGGDMTAGVDPTRRLANDTLSGKYMDPNSNPYLAGAVKAAQRGTIENLTQEMIPGLRGNAQLAGTYGGDRTDMYMEKAISDALVKMNQDAMGIYAGNYSAERDRQMVAPQLFSQANAQGNDSISAILQGLMTGVQGVEFGQQGLDTEMAGLSLGDAANEKELQGQQIIGQTGDQQQAWTQAGLDAALKKWQMDLETPWYGIGQMSNLLNGGGFNSQTQSQQIPRAPSIFQGGVGGGMTGYQLASQAGMKNPAQWALIASALGGASGY